MAEPTLFLVDGDHYVPTEHTRGPWADDLMHGGPVAALLGHVLAAEIGVGADEAAGAAADWFPARFTADFMRALPMIPLTLTTRLVRAGRRARLVDAEVLAGGKLVARATLQQIRAGDVPVPADGPARAWTTDQPEPPEDLPRGGMATDATLAFHATSVEHRTRGGLLGEVGPARDWIRVLLPLLPGVELSPYERVLAAADFGNGVSTSLPFDQYAFVNADLTVHLFRLPVDEWVLLDAVTAAGDQGIGLAHSALSDRVGSIGRSCQSLAIDRR